MQHFSTNLSDTFLKKNYWGQGNCDCYWQLPRP